MFLLSQYLSFIMAGMDRAEICCYYITVKAPHPPQVADLVAAFEAFYIFPNLLAHSTSPPPFSLASSSKGFNSL